MKQCTNGCMNSQKFSLQMEFTSLQITVKSASRRVGIMWKSDMFVLLLCWFKQIKCADNF